MRCWPALGRRDVFGRIGERIFGVAAIAFEERADLNRQSFVQDIPFNMAGRAELDLAGADAAFDPAAHDRFLGIDVTDDDGLLTDDQTARANVAIDLAVDLHVASREQGAAHDQIGANDRGNAIAAGWALWLLLCRLRWRWRNGSFRFLTLDEHFYLP